MVLSIEEIGRFIDEDRTLDRKRFAREGQRYYEGDHDIKHYRLWYYNADGVLVEDKTRSNIKIAHPFFTELVDQQVQYMLSGDEPFMQSDLPELQDQLDAYFNDNEGFTAELYDCLTDTIVKGWGYMFAYKDSDDRLAFQNADTLGVVEVRAKDTDDGCEYVIYHYVDRIGKNRQKITRIQVWSDTETRFYVRDGEGKITPDESTPLNPRPHVLYVENGEMYYEGFGYIPFFRLDNCKHRFNGLKPIKGLIDDYDLMSCGLSNNLQDVSEALYVVSGFQGDNLDELITNLKTKKTIGVDSGGSVDIKTIDIPYEARRAKLDLDETNIYRFGMGFNSAQVGDGNITNVVIKSRYALLDLKCNKLEIRLKRFLRQMLRPVLAEINERDGTDYRQSDVRIRFEREVMTNTADNAAIRKTDAETEQIQINTLLNLAQTLDDETLAKRICEVLDLDWERVADNLPDPDAAANAAYDALQGVTDGQMAGAGAEEPSGQ